MQELSRTGPLSRLLSDREGQNGRIVQLVHLVPFETEQATIATVRDLRRDSLSIRAIAAKLNADGIPARGTRWYATSVARLLRRELV